MPIPRMLAKPEIVVTRGSSNEAALRLLRAERSEEIFPILLEEIVNLGFPRALTLEMDFDTGQIKPGAALNCDRQYLAKFHTSLWASENPLVTVLKTLTPALVPAGTITRKALFAHPMLYRGHSRCREAEHERGQSCLAVRNYHLSRQLPVEEQLCISCGMRGYAAIAVAEVMAGTTETDLRKLGSLIEQANAYLSRLFKVDHYYSRVRDMEATISRLQAVMQSMTDPVILTDNQHRVVIQNRAAERFFRVPEGVSEGGKRAVELNNLLFSAALSSMAVSGTDTSRDLTLVDVMDGEEVLFEAVSAPTYTSRGNRTGMVTVMRDVTDLRRADDEVRANLDKLRAAEDVVRQDRDRLNLVIENVGDPIIVADNSAKVVLTDPLAKELFRGGDLEKDPELVKNQAKFDAYLTSFTFSFVDKENKSLRLYNPVTQGEIEYAARSGKIYDARGQVAYTVTVLRDFSTWKKLEQLQLERRMLEMEKFAATGRLAGTIAHEINNPLESIKNAIHLLADNVDPKAQPIYGVLKNETERVTRIVRQMLGLYRNTAQMVNFDLGPVVEDTLILFAQPLAKSHILVEKQLGHVSQLKGSADQFRQLLSNLVVNSRDSMKAGGKLIVRTKEARSPDGLHGWLTLTVADTGCGIPANIQKRMFEPFVSTKGTKGTGLGLWIVKGIVENHNGRIKARSIVGKGTVIRLTFPISH